MHAVVSRHVPFEGPGPIAPALPATGTEGRMPSWAEHPPATAGERR
ncbi:hypothetical protein AB0G15_29390 [Streptosporangium sp. NPDC023825]